MKKNIKRALACELAAVVTFLNFCAGIIVSVMIFAKLWTPVPMAAVVCYGFLSLRADDTAIMDYIFNAAKFFLTSQQLFLWRKN